MKKTTPIFAEIQTKLTTGKWMLCKTMNDGYVINYNQCPKLIFKSNNIGFYVKPSSKRITFEWKLLNEGSLSIMLFDVEKENEPIKRGVYKIVFNSKSKYIELQLKHVDTDLIYFLEK